jgi:hypothetical protein
MATDSIPALRITREGARQSRAGCFDADAANAATGVSAVEYVDLGINGTKEKRPELDRLRWMLTGVASTP